MTDIQLYRIGWGRLPRLVGEYRRLLPLIVRGVQVDGRRVQRRRWWPKIRRDLRTVLTHHPKYLLHLPWQAEADGQRFARRGLTASAAARRMVADVDHEVLHGMPSRYQRYRRFRTRRWDRKNLPAGDPVIQAARRLARRYGICWRHRTAYRYACLRCQKVRYQ